MSDSIPPTVPSAREGVSREKTILGHARELIGLECTPAEIDKAMTIVALEIALENQTVAGKILGMTRDKIRYRMAKYEIQSKREKEAELKPCY